MNPSRTAEVMALFRALETRKPADERLFEDPIADAFLRRWALAGVSLGRFGILRTLIEGVVDDKWPGARTSAISRTRLFDEAIRRALDDDVRQIVLLGAGFDCRAHRLQGINRARVFEVDQPATQALKIAGVRRRFGSLPPHVVHVAVDFQTQTVDGALRENGFDSAAPCFVLWEGVTNYLSEQAVDVTVRALARLAAPQSHFALTYVHRGLLDGTVTFTGGAQILERVRAAGEPWTWGLDPAEVGPYLRQRGWALTEDLSADDYRVRYWGAAARQMTGYSFYRAVFADRAA